MTVIRLRFTYFFKELLLTVERYPGSQLFPIDW